MKLSRRFAVVVGLVCGAELVVLAVVGGAGLGALFGWEGAVVGGIVVALLGMTVARRVTSARDTPRERGRTLS